MYAWKEETVKTPRRLSVCFVVCVTCVRTPWNESRLSARFEACFALDIGTTN